MFSDLAEAKGVCIKFEKKSYTDRQVDKLLKNAFPLIISIK